MNIVSLNKKQLINRSDFDLHITTFLHYMRWGGEYFRKKIRFKRLIQIYSFYPQRPRILSEPLSEKLNILLISGDYDVKPCHGSHCPPCRSQYPSCIGRPDGLSPWQGRELTHHYVICSLERAIFRGVCTHSRIFHPTKLKCVNSTTLNKISEIV